jgi:hypothetical protein
MKSLFLIDRGEPPANFTPGPAYRRVLWTDSSRVARRLAGDTAAGASAWQNFGSHNKSNGLLLVRWHGLDVDYGVEFHASALPDGTLTGFHHRDNRTTWGLIPGSVWWASEESSLPKWLRKLGVLAWDELGPENGTENVYYQAIRADEALASAKDTGNRPFGFRAVAGWKALAASPGERTLLLPGMEPALAVS